MYVRNLIILRTDYSVWVDRIESWQERSSDSKKSCKIACRCGNSRNKTLLHAVNSSKQFGNNNMLLLNTILMIFISFVTYYNLLLSYNYFRLFFITLIIIYSFFHILFFKIIMIVYKRQEVIKDGKK